MAFILNEATEGYTDNMALFTVPEYDTGITEINTRDYRPVSQINGTNVLEFNIPNNGTDYLMLKDARLKLTLQILDSKGEQVKNHKVGVINLAGATIFRQCDLSLQQKHINNINRRQLRLQSDHRHPSGD